MPSHSHRSGALKQSNKKHKGAKASKRSLSRLSGAGRVNVKIGNNKRVISQSKANRKNELQQKRSKKRQQILRQKRNTHDHAKKNNCGVGGGVVTPRVIGIISLSNNEQLEQLVRAELLKNADTIFTSTNNKNNNSSSSNGSNHGSSGGDNSVSISAKFDSYKKEGYVTLLTNSTCFRKWYDHDDQNSDNVNNAKSAAVLSALDLGRVCDMILWLVDGDDDNHNNSRNTHDYDNMISARGDAVLSAMKGQGMPTPMTVLVHQSNNNNTSNDIMMDMMENNNSDDDNDDDDDMMTIQSTITNSSSIKSIRRSNMKRKLELRKYVGRFAATEFGEDHTKVMEIQINDNNNSSNNNNNDNDILSTTTTATSKHNGTGADVQQLIRTICTRAALASNWIRKSPRSYILSDQPYKYDETNYELHISGYVRGGNNGVPLDINSLFHIPHLGTYACKSIQKTIPPLLLNRKQKTQQKQPPNNNPMEEQQSNNNSNNESTTTSSILYSDPKKRESLQIFATPDALEGEQNLIGFDENDDNDIHNNGDFYDNNNHDSNNVANATGAATSSDYQSAWLDDVHETEDAKDHFALSKEFNTNKNSSASTVGGMMDDDDDDDNMVSAKERKLLMDIRRKKEQEEDSEFPDEVQVNEDGDVTARDRFARYRSLKSFRKSYWDPKENLPESYATVFQFNNYRATQRSIVNEKNSLTDYAMDECNNTFWGKGEKSDANKDDDMMMVNTNIDNTDDDDDDDDLLDGCIPNGTYVTMIIENVGSPSDKNNNNDSNTTTDSIRNKLLRCNDGAGNGSDDGGVCLAVASLLPHENKVSVLHFGLSRVGANASDDDDQKNSDNTIKSKDTLIFRCGWRTWESKPVFSQNNLNSDKHKFERFLPNISNVFFVASVFGPITYGPCPVLVFLKKNGAAAATNNNIGDTKSIIRSEEKLLAIGSITNVDVDRIVLKRIVLTGYPVKVRKRHATVKYMFYNPEDVKWFQPAELYTKHGLHGNIVQSVGEHGTMKVLFNAPIQQHDTVCLPLYKRIYPKYAYHNHNDSSDNDDNKLNLVIR